MSARLDEGAIVDEVYVDGAGMVAVRLTRCPAGWQAAFEVRHASIGDLAVVHRLVAGSMREAKAAVPRAIAYLTGQPVDGSAWSGDAPSLFV